MATVTGSRDVTAANFLSNADNNIFKKSNISILSTYQVSNCICFVVY